MVSANYVEGELQSIKQELQEMRVAIQSLAASVKDNKLADPSKKTKKNDTEDSVDTKYTDDLESVTEKSQVHVKEPIKNNGIFVAFFIVLSMVAVAVSIIFLVDFGIPTIAIVWKYYREKHMAWVTKQVRQWKENDWATNSGSSR
ncbi:uncharacterized protein RJT20DRAFT_133961 [Scheffersomyces xylosifermentans]|uniref:uncharacterized protein n=1 Tax=Scheffersomyces xylosifermentans TaxID=1304137 RepID=UPI00315DE15B